MKTLKDINSLAKLPLIYKYNLLLFSIIVCSSCTNSSQESGNNKNKLILKQMEQKEDTLWWKKGAEDMVNNQIISRGVRDKKVIKVMKNTPRHLFVPKDLIMEAYDDRPLSIGEEQTISQPYIVALMTELLNLKGHEKVLEIGTGSGYQAAVLSQLTDTCYSIELLKNLAEKASIRLSQLGYNNVVVKCDDGYKGWAEHAPFDCIIITAAPEEIPKTLMEQLKIDGRMVVPVGKYSQNLLLITKTKNGFTQEDIIPVRFVPMVKPK